MDNTIGTTGEYNIQANAIILSGGAGKRIGGKEKAFLPDGKKSFIERKINLIKPFVNKIIIVTNQPELYQNLDAGIVTDNEKGIGPLMGLYCGLKASDQELNFITTSDTPFLSPELVEYLLNQSGTVDAVVPNGEKGLEPLCAVYSKNCIPSIEKVMNQRKVRSFFEYIKILYISKEIIQKIDPEGLSFFNINSEDDYSKFLQIRQLN